MSPDAPTGSRPLQVLGIAGSLRAGSYNVSLLQAARELAPKGMEVRVFSLLGKLPLYNADLEKGSCPDAVAALRSARENRTAAVSKIRRATIALATGSQ